MNVLSFPPFFPILCFQKAIFFITMVGLSSVTLSQSSWNETQVLAKGLSNEKMDVFDINR